MTVIGKIGLLITDGFRSCCERNPLKATEKESSIQPAVYNYNKREKAIFEDIRRGFKECKTPYAVPKDATFSAEDKKIGKTYEVRHYTSKAVTSNKFYGYLSITSSHKEKLHIAPMVSFEITGDNFTEMEKKICDVIDILTEKTERVFLQVKGVGLFMGIPSKQERAVDEQGCASIAPPDNKIVGRMTLDLCMEVPFC